MPRLYADPFVTPEKHPKYATLFPAQLKPRYSLYYAEMYYAVWI